MRMGQNDSWNIELHMIYTFISTIYTLQTIIRRRMRTFDWKESVIVLSTSTFNWLGVENAEVIFLNDFRWSPAVLPWEQLLQLLEGDEVTFPTPKNHCDKNISFHRDSPIFATSSDEIVSNKYGTLMVKESKMMKRRWKVYGFTYEIPEEDIREVKPCGVCFGKLITDPEHLFD